MNCTERKKLTSQKIACMCYLPKELLLQDQVQQKKSEKKTWCEQR